MSSGDTRALIEQAVQRFGDEVPALKQLKLVVRLELRSHGDVPIWRVEVPASADHEGRRGRRPAAYSRWTGPRSTISQPRAA